MSSVNMPNPPPPPKSPMDDDEATRKRMDAENAAIAEAKGTGRGSTIIGGRVIAREAQAARARRNAAQDLDL